MNFIDNCFVFATKSEWSDKVERPKHLILNGSNPHFYLYHISGESSTHDVTNEGTVLFIFHLTSVNFSVFIAHACVSRY